MTLLGINNNNDPKAALEFEKWLGRRIDFYSHFLNSESWDRFDTSVDWSMAFWRDFPRPAIWSVPIIPTGAVLARAADGDYNAHYQRAARMIAEGRSEPVIYIRTGWEFNGDWMPWASKGLEQEFIGAFRQLTACFRQASDRFRFVWCPNIGQLDPAPSYPGDDHVDAIGLDFYISKKFDPHVSANDLWIYEVTRPFGLQWHLQFSRSRGKPICFPEWGVCYDNFAPYVEKAGAWFRDGKALYQAYWDTNLEYPGRLSDGAYPLTGAGFKTAFGP
jgi:beta-mannanase